jgi:NADH:ubiquinone oxidoreductase subunit 6 (subunit J)
VSIVVWFAASVGAIGCAIAVVWQPNPFVSALALLGNLASLATLYLLLQSDFVAAAQVIVYAGAVMVMFLFVIAYVGPRGELPQRRRPAWQIVAAVVAAAAILAEIAFAVGGAALEEPASVDEQFGSPSNVGALLVTNYLIAFEVVSLLLMVAAIAGVVLGSGPRPRRVETGERKVEDQDEARRARSRALLDDALADESATRQVGE